MDTQFASELEAAANKSKLDHVCKRLLSEKSILAWIMKECLEEYKSCSISEIAERYIEGTPQVADIAVHPNQTNASKIVGMNTEDSSINEKTIYFDIRFFAVAPSSGELIRLIINVEAQNNYYPGYPLTKRAIYYLSRLISAQYTTEFDHSEYDKLKKVYSVWICMNPPVERRNTITQYSFTKKDMVGMVNEPKENYDLMTAVFLCLGGSSDTDSPILQMLNTLLSEKILPAEKKQILRNDFDISMTDKLDEGVELMCNYSQYVEDRGIEKGINIGVEKGINIGVENGTFNSILSLMATMNWTANEAMNALQVPEADRPKYIEKLKQ